MNKIRIFDIDWDTYCEETSSVEDPQACGLPTEYVVEVEADFDPEEECTDVLSDKFGFCVNSCSYEWVT